MAITEGLLDQLIADYKKPEDLIGENVLLKQLTKRLLELAMQAEKTDHLGYTKNAPLMFNFGNENITYFYFVVKRCLPTQFLAN